jgi:hypothetical protein
LSIFVNIAFDELSKFKKTIKLKNWCEASGEIFHYLTVLIGTLDENVYFLSSFMHVYLTGIYILAEKLTMMEIDQDSVQFQQILINDSFITILRRSQVIVEFSFISPA